VDLNRIIANAAIVTRNQWKYVSTFRTDLDPALPIVTGNPSEIAQVLVNLIINAAQSIRSKVGNELGIIKISTRRDKDQVLITISDTGIGIPPENMSRIFDLFFTTKAPGEGTGQGLAISKSIALRHGGDIKAESAPGAGAVFTITLPIMPISSN